MKQTKATKLDFGAVRRLREDEARRKPREVRDRHYVHTSQDLRRQADIEVLADPRKKARSAIHGFYLTWCERVALSASPAVCGRGLKLDDHCLQQLDLLVARRVRAWIETHRAPGKSFLTAVARRGCFPPFPNAYSTVFYPRTLPLSDEFQRANHAEWQVRVFVAPHAAPCLRAISRLGERAEFEGDYRTRARLQEIHQATLQGNLATAGLD